jgi:deoxyribonuclease IV
MGSSADTQYEDNLLFGTGGSPVSTPKPSSAAGIAQVRALGLDCMELAFVQRVSMGETTAAQVKQAGVDQRVLLSVHGPYYINLNSADEDKLSASRERILKAARVGHWCGARNIVFHAAFYGDSSPEIVYERVKSELGAIAATLRTEGVNVMLRPETTGKTDQFGTLEELLTLSSELPGVLPCVDFAHLHARTGKINSYDEFCAQLKLIEMRLGRVALDDMHIHLSGIQYAAHGERKHLMLQESDFSYSELMQALIDFDVKGLLIVESPDTEKDAQLLQRTYRQLRSARY